MKMGISLNPIDYARKYVNLVQDFPHYQLYENANSPNDIFLQTNVFYIHISVVTYPVGVLPPLLQCWENLAANRRGTAFLKL